VEGGFSNTLGDKMLDIGVAMGTIKTWIKFLTKKYLYGFYLN